MTTIYKAWDLIGYDGTRESVYGLQDALPERGRVRVVGGRTLYEDVAYDDSRGGANVRLARLDHAGMRLRQVSRYVHPDTEVEVVEG